MKKYSENTVADLYNYNAVREMSIECGVQDLACSIAANFELHVLRMIPHYNQAEAVRVFNMTCPNCPDHEGPFNG
tara:strand:- start:1380 stop:1604 length:225 start_codon:yes stop_codon:yes gene_type:complete